MRDKAGMRTISRWMAMAAGTAGILISSVSCGDVARTGKAPAMLIIDSLEAASGANPTTFGGFLLSDVQTMVEQTINGQVVRVPTIFNDLGEVSLRLVMKDQGTSGNGVAPSPLNSVRVHRYRVTFVRSDGRNVPGVDVPYPFDGSVTATIGEQPTLVDFELVRHQAKLEQPLRPLVSFGGRLFISTMAEVTFYGTDLAGNDVQATGNISVSFSDYADPE